MFDIDYVRDEPQTTFEVLLFAGVDRIVQQVNGAVVLTKIFDKYKAPLSYHYGIQFNFELENDFVFATGITQINLEQTGFYILPDTTVSRDTIYNNLKDYKNTFSAISFPILIGKNFKIRRFLLTPEIGLLIQYIYNYDGLRPTENGKTVEFLTPKTFQPISAYFVGGLRLAFKINNSTSVFGYGRWQQATQSIYETTFPVNYKMHIANAGIGIGCKF